LVKNNTLIYALLKILHEKFGHEVRSGLDFRGFFMKNMQFIYIMSK